VPVDFELRGCPIDRGQLVEVLSAFLIGRRPNVPTYSVCLECKRRLNVCVLVASDTPCLGPVTQAGCGALCPASGRGCYGCFGPADTTNARALANRLTETGMTRPDVVRAFRTFNAGAEAFREESERDA
jgi:coenzyme F420-reducing hydrogenase gamma subunit